MSSVSRINPLLAKILLIVALSLVLLLPLGRMESLIAERSALRDSAVERVAHGVGHAQSIGAVMMILPVTRTLCGALALCFLAGRDHAGHPRTRLVSGGEATTIDGCGPRRCRS
jgi:hypothetical protein